MTPQKLLVLSFFDGEKGKTFTDNDLTLEMKEAGIGTNEGSEFPYYEILHFLLTNKFIVPYKDPSKIERGIRRANRGELYILSETGSQILNTQKPKKETLQLIQDQKREFAAIMFTDIVGYTTLMSKNEKKAFEVLSQNRKIQKTIVEQYNGMFIKEIGDGIMISFKTATDAVKSAIKIQEACKVTSQYQLKIGIHMGEMVFQNDDVFGDGVNIASRIEKLGVGSSILVSKTIRDQIKNNSEFELTSMGLFNLKNVDDLIELFALSNPGIVVPQRGEMLAKLAL